MTGRTAVNLGLLAVVAVLGALVYFLPSSERVHPPSVLTRLTPDEVTRVRISRPHGPTVVLSRQDGHWRLLEPIKTAANRFVLKSLLGITRADSFSRFGAGGRDLKEYGLDPPSLHLQLNDLKIAFGGSEPLNGRRYVRIGATVYVIADYFYQEANGGAAGFVSLSLLPEDRQPVRLELPGMVLRRDKAGHWAVAGDARASGGEELVAEWRRARALQVEPYNGGGGHETVTVRFDGGHPPLRYEIVRRHPELVLARPDIGMAYHFPESQAGKLLRLPAAPGANGTAPKAGHPANPS